MMDATRSPRRDAWSVPTAMGTAMLLSLAACDAKPGTQVPKPGLRALAGVAPSLYHDFGTLRLGTSATHDFEIPVPENDYGDVIVDHEFVGVCSCATGMVMIASTDGKTSKAVYSLPPDQRVVRPGEKVIVRLTLDTKDKEPVEVTRTLTTGRLRFQLVADDVARYETVLVRFHYGVHTPIRVSPVAHIDFGELPQSRVYTQTLELIDRAEGRKITWGEVDVAKGTLTARLEAKGGKTLLHVRITPQVGLRGEVRDRISIGTGLPEYPVLRIAVSGRFVGDIQYFPAENLSFDLFDFRKPKERFLSIIDHDTSRAPGFVLRGVVGEGGEDLSRHFAVTFKPLSGRKTRVTARYLGTMGGISFRGWLSLAKVEGGPEVARVPFQGHNAKR